MFICYFIELNMSCQWFHCLIRYIFCSCIPLFIFILPFWFEILNMMFTIVGRVVALFHFAFGFHVSEWKVLIHCTQIVCFLFLGLKVCWIELDILKVCPLNFYFFRALFMLLYYLIQTSAKNFDSVLFTQILG